MEALARALGADAVRETHTSWVLLTRDRAYKLKKPVRLAFVDLSTPGARRRACEEEVRVNRGGVVLGVRGVLPDLRLTGADDPAATEWVVEMRRFDEGRTMAALLGRGELQREDVRAAARRIVAFHADAGRLAHGRAPEAWQRNLDELEALTDAPAVGALRAFAEGFLARRGGELEARAARGLVRDGHGDLRADHVLLEEGGVILLDRLEFDAELRVVDVADDLAFLATDLESRGARWAADAVVDEYRAAGGDPGDDGLIAFFGAYRALVRAKVELVRGTAAPTAFLALAERIAWRARPPELLVVCGPPASGKSTLAAALADRTGLAVLSSDAIRKELLGIETTQRAPLAAYAPAGRRAVYEQLAARVPATGGAIVDATFGDPADRALMPQRARWVECRAPLATLMQRARGRARGDPHGSDAGAPVAAQLARVFAPLTEVPHVVVDGAGDTDATLRRIGTWLDRPPPQRRRAGRNGDRRAPRSPARADTS